MNEFNFEFSPESHLEEIRRFSGKMYTNAEIEQTIASALENGSDLGDSGTPVVVADPDSAAAGALRELADALRKRAARSKPLVHPDRLTPVRGGPIVTLLTDFGTADSYVAEMKGVLLTHAPAAVLVDITHEIPPGDVLAGQQVLDRAWRRFPPGSIHLAVVDPDVGTSRRALALAARGHRFVGPDNGLLTPVLDGADIVSLPIPGTAAPTFHGRDVFAPAAAALVERHRAPGAWPSGSGSVPAAPARARAPRWRRARDGHIHRPVRHAGHQRAGSTRAGPRRHLVGGPGHRPDPTDVQ